MEQNLILFYSILGLCALTVAFSLLDWFSIARLSAKIADVENEIEKKSVEFDLIKKGGTASDDQSTGHHTRILLSDEDNQGQQAPQYEQPGYDDSPDYENPYGGEDSADHSETQIHVVRNIRNAFGPTGTEDNPRLETNIVDMSRAKEVPDQQVLEEPQQDPQVQ
jgi:hypothetical protein